MNYGLLRAAEKYAPRIRKAGIRVDHEKHTIMMPDRVIQLPQNLSSAKATLEVKRALEEAEKIVQDKKDSKQTKLFE